MKTLDAHRTRQRAPHRRTAAGLLVTVLTACGGNDGDPTAPNPSQPAFTFTIFGPHVVPNGMTVTYVANSTPSNPSLSPLRPIVWSTDNANVATITSAGDGYGELTGMGRGTVTITAKYQSSMATFLAEVRPLSDQTSGSNLMMSFTPDPVPGSPLMCPDIPVSPTWSFTETITETRGVGFTVETATFSLYGEDGRLLYVATEPEEFHFAPRSTFTESSCTFLFTNPSGFYVDILEGIDDLGNRLAFASRLRLLPLSTASQTSEVSASGRQRRTRKRA